MKNLKIPKPDPIYHYPDAKKHQIISFVKSAIRIIGYIYLPFNILAAAGLLIMSEVVGIYDDLV